MSSSSASPPHTDNVEPAPGSDEEPHEPGAGRKVPSVIKDFLYYSACFAIAPVAAYLLAVLLRMIGVWWRRPAYFIARDILTFSEDTIQHVILSIILAFVFASMRWINTKKEQHGFPLLGIIGGIIAIPFGLFAGVTVLLVVEDVTTEWIEIGILYASGAFSAAIVYMLTMKLRFATPPRYKRELITWSICLLALVSTIALNPRSSFPRHAESAERYAWAKEHMGHLFPRLEERLFASKAVHQFAGEQVRIDLPPDRHGMVYSPDEGNWERLEGSVKVIGTRGSMTCDFTLYGDPIDGERSNFDALACRTNVLYLDLDEDGEVIEAAPFVSGGSYSYSTVDRRRYIQNLDPELEHIRDLLIALPWLRNEAGDFEKNDVVLVRGGKFRPEQIHPFHKTLAIVVQVKGKRNELYCRVGVPWGDISGDHDIVECWRDDTGRRTYIASSNLLVNHANQINPSKAGWFDLKGQPPGSEVEHVVAHHEGIVEAYRSKTSFDVRLPDFAKHFSNSPRAPKAWRRRFPDRLYLSGAQGRVDFSLVHVVVALEDATGLCEVTSWATPESEYAEVIAAQHPERRCWTKTHRFSFDTHDDDAESKIDTSDPDIRNALTLPDDMIPFRAPEATRQ